MSPRRLCTDSQMLLRRGEARTEIRGHSTHTDPDEEVLLPNFGIFTTSLCLLSGCWQHHVRAETTGELCVCCCSPALVEQLLRNVVWLVGQKYQDTFFPAASLGAKSGVSINFPRSLLRILHRFVLKVRYKRFDCFHLRRTACLWAESDSL